jgi:Transposase, Mutator family
MTKELFNWPHVRSSTLVPGNRDSMNKSVGSRTARRSCRCWSGSRALTSEPAQLLAPAELNHVIREDLGDARQERREVADEQQAASELHLAPGTKEDTASCTAFFEDRKRRGLPDPLLAVTDGAPGLIRAVETCFPRALRQRCLVHRLRNLRKQGARAAVAGDRDPGPRLLRGRLAGAADAAARRFRPGVGACQRPPHTEPPGSGKLSHLGSPIQSQAGSPILSHPGSAIWSHPVERDRIPSSFSRSPEILAGAHQLQEVTSGGTEESGDRHP